jgi:hypothetical protein
MCGSPFLTTFYNCDCIEKKRREEEQAYRIKRKKQLYDLRIKDSGLPKLCVEKRFSIPEKSILIKDEDTGEPIDIREYAQIHAFINNLERNIKTGSSLFLPGNPGTGKTIILGEIGKLAIELEYEVRYFTASKIFNEKVDLSKLRFTFEPNKKAHKKYKSLRGKPYKGKRITNFQLAKYLADQGRTVIQMFFIKQVVDKITKQLQNAIRQNIDKTLK